MTVWGKDVGVHTISAVCLARDAIAIVVNDFTFGRDTNGTLWAAFSIGDLVVRVGAGDTVVASDTVASRA